MCQSLAALLHLGKPTASGSIGLNAFKKACSYQVNYVFLPSALLPLVLSKFLAEHFTGQFRLVILAEPCCIEGLWLPIIFNMLEDRSFQCPIIIKSHQGCFDRPGGQGSANAAFNPVAAQKCVLCR